MEDRTEVEAAAGVEHSCSVYEAEDGRVVLYDENNPDAYVRSDLTIDVER